MAVGVAENAVDHDASKFSLCHTSEYAPPLDKARDAQQIVIFLPAVADSDQIVQLTE